VKARAIQVLLQKIRIAVARLGAEAGRQTIAERNDRRARIYWYRGFSRPCFIDRGCRIWRLRSATAQHGEAESENK